MAERIRTPAGGAIHPLGVLLAACAAVWHAFLMSKVTNDNFLHMTLARQLLAGDWPVRDFFDHGWVLQYTLSAAAQSTLGDRLLSEAVIVGTLWAISTYLVFRVVQRLTTSTPVAALAALLLIVAGARGYSYPKGIAYAVAAALWWAYVRKPTTSRIIAFGAWAAVAFYWRPDHGMYVAVGIALAVIAAHGVRPIAAVRTSLAGATTLALIAPFLVYVQVTSGLPEYVQAGLAQGQLEHATHGTHDWPLVRFAGGFFTVEPAEDYAPTIGIRWSSASSVESRRQVLERYDLTPLPSDDDVVERVRLSERSIPQIRALINEPIIDDTARIDRSTATLPASSWPMWQRWTFNHPLLRLRVLPSLDTQGRASEFTVALFYALPIVVMLAAPWIARYLGPDATAGRIAAFAVFAFVVDFAMLRNPFPARAPDAVVLSAVLYGCCIAWLWRVGAGGYVRRVFLRAAAVILVLVMTSSVAGAGQFGERVNWLAGQWTSMRRARGAWSEAYGELVSSPPLSYFRDRPAGVSLRLAAYVRECVPANDRLLVLWFAPEIYYHSDRLMAQQHLVFVPTWSSLPHEQQTTLDKIRRYDPPIALARRSALEEYTRASYPGVMDYVDRQYELAATIEENKEQYLILARRGRPPLRRFGPETWPCYSSEPSSWWRVGRDVNLGDHFR